MAGNHLFVPPPPAATPVLDSPILTHVRPPRSPRRRPIHFSGVASHHASDGAFGPGVTLGWFLPLQTALHWAAKHGSEDMATLLANAGADVNSKSVSVRWSHCSTVQRFNI